MEKKLYPMQLDPAFKDYIWGGTRLKTLFKKQTDLKTVAESWEVSDRDDGPSFIANGTYKGKSLKQVVKLLGKDLIGKEGKSFPLLIKLIDANDTLSVQVHPDEKKAEELDAEPKNESWTLLDCESLAKLYLGVDEDVTKEDLFEAIEKKQVEKVLRSCTPKKNEAVFVKAGTLHAIGKGCLILEVQQSSNTTYRVFDWNRTGKDGKPRELHIEESKQCIHVDSRPVLEEEELVEIDDTNSFYSVLETLYFNIEKWVIKGRKKIPHSQASFNVFFAIEGNGHVIANKKVPLEFGKTILVPAGVKNIELEAQDHLVVYRIYLP